MVRPTQKNKIYLIIDLYTDQKFVKKILKQFIVHKGLLKSKDAVELFFLHHSKDSQGFVKHEDTLFPHSDIILKLYEEVLEDREQHDWLKAFNGCIKRLNEDEEDKCMSGQIIFISDFKAPAEFDQKIVNNIVKAIVFYEAYLVVVTDQDVDYGNAHLLCTVKDFADHMKNINLSKGCSEELNTALKIVQECKAVLCGPNIFLDMLELFVAPKKGQPYKEPLKLGNYSFFTIATRILRPQNNLCKRHLKQTVKYYTETDDWQSTEELPEVEKEDVIHVYKYHNRIVDIPTDIAKKGAYVGPRFFKIVAFVKSSEVPDIFLDGGEAHMVRLENPERDEQQVFQKLIEETKNQQVYGLALRAYNKNNQPKLYVLMPQTDWFLMVPLVVALKENYVVKPASSTQEPKTEIPENILAALKKAAANVPLLHPRATVSNVHKSCVDFVLNSENIIDKIFIN